MTDMAGDWIYLLDYCIEMAYRRSHRRMSRKAGRASRKGGLKRGRRATRKGGLKRGGLSRRVKRGGGAGVVPARATLHTPYPDDHYTWQPNSSL